jgi:competence protein ComEA
MLKKILALLAMLYAALSFAAVDVNKGTAADLDGIKGIGPAISTKIVDERKKGNFKDWNDFISRVNGIGDKSAAKLSEAGLTVNGSGFAGAAAPAAKAAAKPVTAAAAPAAAPAVAPAAKEEKKDAKADAKAQKEADKKAKAEEKQKKSDEAKAKKEADKKAKADAKAAKDAKPAAKDDKAEAPKK